MDKGRDIAKGNGIEMIKNEKQREYRAAWSKANPEKERASRAAYKKANYEKICAKNAAYRKANPEKTGAAWQKANPEKARAVRAAYRKANAEREKAASAAWRKAHPDKGRANNTAWAKTHPEERAAIHANRRARKQNAEGSHTAGEIKQLLARQKCRCAACKKSVEGGYHKDHIVPLSRGGSNYIRNIQLLCPKCNLKKKDKHPVKFMQEMGYLL